MELPAKDELKGDESKRLEAPGIRVGGDEAILGEKTKRIIMKENRLRRLLALATDMASGASQTVFQP